MKIPICLLFLCFGSSTLFGEYELPPDISAGIAQSRGGEGGGFSINGIDETVYKNYIKQHWREVADNIESLPLAQSSYGNYIIKDRQAAINASAASFAASCEVLDPMEYLDFLDKWLDLYEQKRIEFHALSRHWGGETEKRSFLEVNWEHPRLQKYFQRLLAAIPREEEAFRELVVDVSKGKLADNYLTQREDSFRPQTLPGTKLERPWNSLIKKYERMTGKKYPPDPEFEEVASRVQRRPVNDDMSVDIPDNSSCRNQAIWIGVGVGFLIFLVVAFRKVRRYD